MQEGGSGRLGAGRGFREAGGSGWLGAGWGLRVAGCGRGVQGGWVQERGLGGARCVREFREAGVLGDWVQE